MSVSSSSVHKGKHEVPFWLLILVGVSVGTEEASAANPCTNKRSNRQYINVPPSPPTAEQPGL